MREKRGRVAVIKSQTGARPSEMTLRQNSGIGEFLRLRRRNNRGRHIRIRTLLPGGRIVCRHLVAVCVTVGDAVAVSVGGCCVRRRRIQLRIASARARRCVIERAVNVVARHSRRTARRPREPHRIHRRRDCRTRQAHAGWRVAGVAGERSGGRRRTTRCRTESHGISRALARWNRYRERQPADHKL